MRPFHIVYYISLGCPSIEYSLQKAEFYLLSGIKALQFDLPSRDPYRENPFIRDRMAHAYQKYRDYDCFLDALTEFRARHPAFEMQMVCYEDVLLTIGTKHYIEFCLRNGIRTCRVAGEGVIELARKDMNAAGIDTLTFIDYDMNPRDVEFARETGRAVMLRNARAGMQPRGGMVTWAERIRFLRQNGISAPIYATAEMNCSADLRRAWGAGADGAFVGSCLMALWDDEPAMLALLRDLNAANAEE